MKLVQVIDLNQSYSFLQTEKPAKAWAFPILSTSPPGGIPQQVLETLKDQSQAWTGWGFDKGEALLLFEKREDAIFARLQLGEDLNV